MGHRAGKDLGAGFSFACFMTQPKYLQRNLPAPLTFPRLQPIKELFAPFTFT